jgi:hypothetical protein
MYDLSIPFPPSASRGQRLRLSDQILAQLPAASHAVIEVHTLHEWLDRARTLEWGEEASSPASVRREVSLWRVRRGFWWRLRRLWRGRF